MSDITTATDLHSIEAPPVRLRRPGTPQEETVTDTCDYPGCPRPTLAKGWCKAHYNQNRTGRPLHPVGQRPPRPTCTIDGCNRPHKAKGLCLTHYDQHRAGKQPGDIRPKAPGRSCTIDGCNRPHEAKGLCKRHYNQARTGTPAPGQPTCTIDGCPDGVKAGGLCNRHYCEQRRRATGTQPRTNPQPKIKNPPRQAQTPPSNLPKGWNRPAPKPRPTPIAADHTDIGPIPPIAPELAATVAAKLTRWGCTDLIDMLLGDTQPDTRQEAA